MPFIATELVRFEARLAVSAAELAGRALFAHIAQLSFKTLHALQS
jgi:hypothetical protein